MVEFTIGFIIIATPTMCFGVLFYIYKKAKQHQKFIYPSNDKRSFIVVENQI